ncbi:hypothetical protein EV361DRAFT_795313 [Lentinula raphanica]|nr:hypothetical protein EV361DRAFT_795313 [Lentinula raphanica]
MGLDFLEEDAYVGVLKAINEDASHQARDVLDDLEETQDNVGLDFENSEGQKPNTEDVEMLDMTELMRSIKEVSKGVSEKTAQEYARLMKQCEKFVHERKLIPDNVEFFSAEPYPQSAQCLVAWIMHQYVFLLLLTP